MDCNPFSKGSENGMNEQIFQEHAFSERTLQNFCQCVILNGTNSEQVSKIEFTGLLN